MELSKLRELVSTLRELGVTKYCVDGVELELGEAPKSPAPVDLRKEGFAPSNGRSPELNAILDRIDPQYSDAALFAITEVKRG